MNCPNAGFPEHVPQFLWHWYKVLLSDFSGNGINDYYMGFDDVFYYGNGGFEWDTEMYYGDGTKWIRFK